MISIFTVDLFHVPGKTKGIDGRRVQSEKLTETGWALSLSISKSSSGTSLLSQFAALS
jgi:hypothetical protein